MVEFEQSACTAQTQFCMPGLEEENMAFYPELETRACTRPQ